MEVAQLAAKKTNYQGVEQALEYIFGRGERDNLLNHDYIEGRGGDCFICRESRDQHRQIIEVRNNLRSRSVSGNSAMEEFKVPVLIKNQSALSKEADANVPQFNHDQIRIKSKSLAEKL